MRLVAIVKAISDVAEEGLTELSLCNCFKGSEVEKLESRHTGKVYPVGKFAF